MEEAIQAAEAGVDAIIAQGIEAGGHVSGKVNSMSSRTSLLQGIWTCCGGPILWKPGRGIRHWFCVAPS